MSTTVPTISNAAEGTAVVPFGAGTSPLDSSKVDISVRMNASRSSSPPLVNLLT